MTISPAQLAANQANAAKSTGPQTAAGKAKSRANAVKHGLRSLVVPVADEATIRARAVGVLETIRPQTELQAWLCGVVAQRTIQLDRMTVIERQTRDEVAHRADTCWEADQKLAAGRLAARLTRDPERTVGLLRQTVAGCDWLMTRWMKLADLASRQLWTDEQKTLAHDLLGTPPEFRSDPPTYQLDACGKAIVPEPTEVDFAQAQVAELSLCRDVASGNDEATQALAAADLNDFKNSALGRVRRYGRMLWSDLNQALDHARREIPPTVANSRFLRSLPAQFFSSPTPAAAPNEPIFEAIAPNEPMIDSTLAAPNEPIIESAAPNEPIFEAIAPNEPMIEPIKPPAAPNEPRIESIKPPIAPAKPRSSGSGRDLGWERAFAQLHPDLQILLEEGLPDPDTLDPAWCRQFVAGRLGIDPSQLMGGGGPDPSPPSGHENPGSGGTQP